MPHVKPGLRQREYWKAVTITAQQHRRLKERAVKEDTSMTALLDQLIDDFLGTPPPPDPEAPQIRRKKRGVNVET